VRLELESEVWGNELKLLDSIGTAQMSIQLQGEVAKLVKEHSDKMVNEVGVEPNLSVEDAKQYLDEVMKELNKHRSSK
jgi:polyhydroxyalkanoate synthesis regulator phasin